MGYGWTIYASNSVCAYFEPKGSKMCSTIRLTGINSPSIVPDDRFVEKEKLFPKSGTRYTGFRSGFFAYGGFYL